MDAAHGEIEGSQIVCKQALIRTWRQGQRDPIFFMRAATTGRRVRNPPLDIGGQQRRKHGQERLAPSSWRPLPPCTWLGTARRTVAGPTPNLRRAFTHSSAAAAHRLVVKPHIGRGNTPMKALRGETGGGGSGT